MFFSFLRDRPELKSIRYNSFIRELPWEYIKKTRRKATRMDTKKLQTLQDHHHLLTEHHQTLTDHHLLVQERYYGAIDASLPGHWHALHKYHVALHDHHLMLQKHHHLLQELYQLLAETSSD